MITISKNHAKVYEAIKSGCTRAVQIASWASMGIGITRERISTLSKLGLINAVGTTKGGKTYTVTGAEFRTTERARHTVVVNAGKQETVDKLLNRLIALKLSPEKRAWLKQNRHRDKAYLCKELGLTRVELNQAIIKYNIKPQATA